MKREMKFIMFIIFIMIFLAGLFLICFNNSSEDELSSEEKNILLQNVKIENENILTNGKNITISGSLKNNNSKPIKIKSLKILLKNDSGNKLVQVSMKINKKVKGNNSLNFSKKIKLSDYSERTFAEYEIIL